MHVPTDTTIKMAPNFSFFKTPVPGEFTKPADLLHELKLMHLRDEAQKRGHISMFWGNNSGHKKADWEGWLRDKGLLRRDNEDSEKRAHGWTDPEDALSDWSEYEDDAW